MIYLQLFLSYLKIGFFGFGGGYAMLSLIQNEIVVRHAWISNQELMDIIAISQITPGPIAVNSATYVGYTVAGVWGSVIATFAVSLPALTIMLVVTKFYLKISNNKYVQGAIGATKPVVIGMIAAASLMLLFSRETLRPTLDWWGLGIFLATAFATYKKVNPILLIVLSAAAGVFIYL